MKVIARFIASLLALFLIFSLPLSLLLFNTGRVLFNPPLVKDVLIELVTESDLVPAGLDWFADQRAQERLSLDEAAAGGIELVLVELLSYLDINDWRAVRWELLPNEILIEWVDVAVDGIYDWLDSDERAPEISWNLRPLIERVNSEHGVNALTIVLDTLPPCTAEQLFNFAVRLLTTSPEQQVPDIMCRFPSPWYSVQINVFAQALALVVSNLPDTLPLTNALERTNDVGVVGPELVKSRLLLTRSVTRLAVWIPAVTLISILIFAVRSLKTFGKWWGYPLALGSLLTLGLSQVYRPAVTFMRSSGLLAKVPSLIREDVLAGIIRLVGAVISPLKTQAVALLLLGLVLIIIGAVLKEKTTFPLEHSLPSEAGGEDGN